MKKIYKIKEQSYRDEDSKVYIVPDSIYDTYILFYYLFLTQYLSNTLEKLKSRNVALLTGPPNTILYNMRFIKYLLLGILRPL